MNSLKFKVTVLLMGAIIAMSVLSMTAAFTVAEREARPSGERVVFRLVHEQPAPGAAAPAPGAAAPAPAVPDPEEPLGMGAVVAVYVALIVAGAAGVSIVVANMVMRPLVMFERAAQGIGRDGLIPHIPEDGLGEVRAAAQVLNRMSDRLRSAIESRMRLVAAAGHDLRTPMTRMRLRAEFLADDEREQWLRDLDELEGIADSAIRLVKEEVEQFDPAPVSIDGLVGEVVGELLETGLDVELTSSAPAVARAGRLALKRAIRNMTVNAATHGGGARVRVGSIDGQACVVIEDDGPGIPEALLARAFEPFFRVDPSRHKKVSGAGLGLAISKEIVTRHGGTVTVRNRVAGGLMQEIRLPAA